MTNPFDLGSTYEEYYQLDPSRRERDHALSMGRKADFQREMGVLEVHARLLPTGTLANLTGLTHVGKLQIIDWHFIKFCIHNGVFYDKWEDAWEQFALGINPDNKGRPGDPNPSRPTVDSQEQTR